MLKVEGRESFYRSFKQQMKRFWRSLLVLNIKMKLLLLFCVTILLPLTIITQIVNTLSVDKIQEQAVSIARGSADQNMMNVQSLLERYTNICNRYSFNDRLITTLSLDERYEDPYASFQAYNLIRNIFVNDIVTIDFQIDMKIYYLNPNFTQDLLNFIQIDRTIEESQMYKRTVEADGQIVWRYENDTFSLSKTITDYNGILLGIIKLELPLSEIRSLIDQHNPDEMKLMFTDAGGFVFASNDKTLEGADVSGEAFFTAQEGQEVLYDNDGEYLYTPANFKRMNDSFPDWNMITMMPLERILKESSEVKRKVLLICLAALLVSSAIFFSILDRITRRIRSLVKRMKNVGEGNFRMVESEHSNDEIGVIINSFDRMTVSLNSLFHENVETRLQLKDVAIKKREAELYALQSQIQPHFLFNTLESIRMKLHRNNEDAANMILNLSKLLRTNLNMKGDIILLSEEINLVRSYLAIQRHRFKERLQYRIDIQEELLDCSIPKLIIQPLVENAIKHGIEKKWGGGTVAITVIFSGERLHIEIEDNGVGMNAGKLDEVRHKLKAESTVSQQGIGIKNVYDRIMLHYGQTARMDIQSRSEEWTKIVIELPCSGNDGNTQA